MFKSKMKLNIVITCMVWLLVLIGGCAKGPVTTDNDVLLPEEFVNVYMLMDYSKQFSELVGNVTSRLLQGDLITVQDKNEIGELWKEHKKYSNRLHTEINIWYKDIKYGDGKFDRQEIYAILERLVNKTELVSALLSGYVGEENAMLISSINNRVFGLYTKIEGE